MRTLNYKTGYQKLLSPEIVSYLAQIHEMKGQQNLFVEAQKDAFVNGVLSLLFQIGLHHIAQLPLAMWQSILIGLPDIQQLDNLSEFLHNNVQYDDLSSFVRLFRIGVIGGHAVVGQSVYEKGFAPFAFLIFVCFVHRFVIVIFLSHKDDF